MTQPLYIAAIASVLLAPGTGAAHASSDDPRAVVAALDTEFQLATKNNDVATIDRILHADYILVAGNGRTEHRDALITAAREKHVIYEQQDEEPGSQVVRVWGDTAVVTAKLWIKGMKGTTPIDYKLWFSDTYVKTPAGWKYAFGQASLPLPPA